jgi:hypothetical protein
MTTHCHAINLPHPGAYAKAWKTAKQAPQNARFRISWDRHNETRETVLRDFEKALQARINIRGNRPEDNEPMPAEWIRDYHAVENRIEKRVRVYAFETKACRRRFPHLLSDRNED